MVPKGLLVFERTPTLFTVIYWKTLMNFLNMFLKDLLFFKQIATLQRNVRLVLNNFLFHQ